MNAGVVVALAILLALLLIYCYKPYKHLVLGNTTPPYPVSPSSFTVAELTSDLSEEERIGWLKTPRYTSTGYKLISLPSDLQAQLAFFHEAAYPEPEEPNHHLAGNVSITSIAGTALEDRLCSFLEVALSQWTHQHNMRFINSYGPRTYAQGSTLAAHCDRIRTHAVSAIVFVSESAGRPWPLQFVSNAGEVVDVVLSGSNNVLLYESMQPHGRVLPLEGESFTVAFFHWQPQGWKTIVDALIGPE